MAVILWCWVDKGQGKKTLLSNFGEESIFSGNTEHTELFSLMSTNNNFHFCCWSIWVCEIMDRIENEFVSSIITPRKRPERRWDIINRAWLNAMIIFWDICYYYYCSQALQTCYCLRVESTEKKKKKIKAPPQQCYQLKNSFWSEAPDRASRKCKL